MRIPEPPPTIDAVLTKDSAALGKAFMDPKYREVLQRVERKYVPWIKVKYMAWAEHLSPELVWAMVKLSRIPTYRALPLLGTGGARLQFNQPDPVQEELMHIDQQLAGRLSAADDQPISHAQQERFVMSALREEAIASSMLEGAATTRRDAKDMLVSGRKPRTTGERMVMNNYHAMTHIREHRDVPLTPEFVLHIQSILTKDTLDRPDESGRFRTSDDIVQVTDPFNNVMHTPPPADELASRLQMLCDFANGRSGTGFVHPVIRASVVHFQIGFDHPFCDGNGRTARALFYWAMLRAGYWLFEYLPISRLIYKGPAKYAAAYLYVETDSFDVTYFLCYKAKIIERAREELSEYINRKQQEVHAARRVFESDHRLNHRQRDVVLRMVRNPSLVLTIQEHQVRHHTAYGTARADLLSLAQWNYVNVVQNGKRYDFVRGARLDAPGTAEPGTDLEAPLFSPPSEPRALRRPRPAPEVKGRRMRERANPHSGRSSGARGQGARKEG